MKKVAGYIERKTMLYKTEVEYGDYTMNHVAGCAHGCTYPCYAFMMKKRFGLVSSYDEWCKPYLVSNTLELLENEIPRLKDKITSVHLCFSTDPFMYEYSEIEEMSLRSIEKLNGAGIPCSVLTKGILPESLASMGRKNEYGITLVSLDEAFREKYEPNAAPIESRLQSLRRLHDAGCKTWVSIEPYPTPNILTQNLQELLESVSFVDRIIFGKLNYSTIASAYKDRKAFYNAAAGQVIGYCNAHNINFHIKNGTIG